jgi:hypothetical protein
LQRNLTIARPWVNEDDGPTMRKDGNYLVIQTTLRLPGKSGFDPQQFANLRQWAESYRVRRYPDLIVDFEET